MRLPAGSLPPRGARSSKVASSRLPFWRVLVEAAFGRLPLRCALKLQPRRGLERRLGPDPHYLQGFRARVRWLGRHLVPNPHYLQGFCARVSRESRPQGGSVCKNTHKTIGETFWIVKGELILSRDNNPKSLAAPFLGIFQAKPPRVARLEQDFPYFLQGWGIDGCPVQWARLQQ